VAAADYGSRIAISVLDRLLDLEPADLRDTPLGRTAALSVLKRAVQRDLEWLLNTRNSLADLPAEFVEAGQSVLTYGLTDFGALNPVNPRDQDRVRQYVERTIREFEPRLRSVNLTVLPGPAGERALRLRLDAHLAVEPAPEPVGFDIVLPLPGTAYEVKDAT
jgi:type VI secretion system protein ImpF